MRGVFSVLSACILACIGVVCAEDASISDVDVCIIGSDAAELQLAHFFLSWGRSVRVLEPTQESLPGLSRPGTLDTPIGSGMRHWLFEASLAADPYSLLSIYPECQGKGSIACDLERNQVPRDRRVEGIVGVGRGLRSTQVQEQLRRYIEVSGIQVETGKRVYGMEMEEGKVLVHVEGEKGETVRSGIVFESIRANGGYGSCDHAPRDPEAYENLDVRVSLHDSDATTEALELLALASHSASSLTLLAPSDWNVPQYPRAITSRAVQGIVDGWIQVKKGEKEEGGEEDGVFACSVDTPPLSPLDAVYRVPVDGVRDWASGRFWARAMAQGLEEDVFCGELWPSTPIGSRTALQQALLLRQSRYSGRKVAPSSLVDVFLYSPLPIYNDYMHNSTTLLPTTHPRLAVVGDGEIVDDDVRGWLFEDVPASGVDARVARWARRMGLVRDFGIPIEYLILESPASGPDNGLFVVQRSATGSDMDRGASAVDEVIERTLAGGDTWDDEDEDEDEDEGEKEGDDDGFESDLVETWGCDDDDIESGPIISELQKSLTHGRSVERFLEEIQRVRREAVGELKTVLDADDTVHSPDVPIDAVRASFRRANDGVEALSRGYSSSLLYLSSGSCTTHIKVHNWFDYAMTHLNATLLLGPSISIKANPSTPWSDQLSVKEEAAFITPPAMFRVDIFAAITPETRNRLDEIIAPLLEEFTDVPFLIVDTLHLPAGELAWNLHARLAGGGRADIGSTPFPEIVSLLGSDPGPLPQLHQLASAHTSSIPAQIVRDATADYRFDMKHALNRARKEGEAAGQPWKNGEGMLDVWGEEVIAAIVHVPNVHDYDGEEECPHLHTSKLVPIGAFDLLARDIKHEHVETTVGELGVGDEDQDAETFAEDEGEEGYDWRTSGVEQEQEHPHLHDASSKDGTVYFDGASEVELDDEDDEIDLADNGDDWEAEGRFGGKEGNFGMDEGMRKLSDDDLEFLASLE